MNKFIKPQKIGLDRNYKKSREKFLKLIQRFLIEKSIVKAKSKENSKNGKTSILTTKLSLSVNILSVLAVTNFFLLFLLKVIRRSVSFL